MRTNQLEGLARGSLLEINAVSCPPDAFVLADSFSLLLTPASASAEGMIGREIRFGGRLSHREQQEFVARCIATWILHREGYCPTHHAIARLARALMMPWDAFVKTATQVRNFDELRRKYPHVSDAMLGARISDVFADRRVRSRSRALSEPARASRL